ncbi:hypothetical protein OUZ56_018298 [Daphnia magna]|uniref:Uncharacterized protein n=1 Tax=Daphnia magna TaxID=35525 RepID=A0ABQ9Z939_9CRUS|nr:hypothetical protein OUZ56_018298 [Daphnia magna]
MANKRAFSDQTSHLATSGCEFGKLEEEAIAELDQNSNNVPTRDGAFASNNCGTYQNSEWAFNSNRYDRPAPNHVPRGAQQDSVHTKLKTVDTESMMELQSQQMEVQICHRYSKTSAKNKETTTPIIRMHHQPTE